MRAGNVVGRLSVFQLIIFRLFILWVPVCPISRSLGGSPLGGFFLWGMFLVFFFWGPGGGFPSVNMFVSSFAIEIDGYLFGFCTQHESVSLPLNVGLNLHWVWWSSPQSVHVSMFVERRPEKLGR